MRKQVSILIFALLGFRLQILAQNTDTVYSENVRKNAQMFHINFSAGDFEKNAPLVNEKIYYDSDNTIVIGRDNFVKDISSLKGSFPGLALRDKIIIVDENQVALFYMMQGIQTGSYGAIPASGNKINVDAVEFFTMDNNALMKELLTITQLDQLERQITGKDRVEKEVNVKLMPIKKVNMEYKRLLKDRLDAYVQNFNTRDWAALTGMFGKDVTIKINGISHSGPLALINELKSVVQKIPDATYHLIRNVAEGDRGAIAYEVNGIISKPGEKENAIKTLQDVKQGIHFQFDERGKIKDMIWVYDSEYFNKQLK